MSPRLRSNNKILRHFYTAVYFCLIGVILNDSTELVEVLFQDLELIVYNLVKRDYRIARRRSVEIVIGELILPLRETCPCGEKWHNHPPTCSFTRLLDHLQEKEIQRLGKRIYMKRVA